MDEGPVLNQLCAIINNKTYDDVKDNFHYRNKYRIW
jgi:hypothetical protein